MSKKTNVYFILDQTGSMAGNKKQTIDGFNEYIKGLQDQAGYDFTLILFNSDNIEKRYDGKDISKVEKLTSETYRPNSTTPLYDAVGCAISDADQKHKKKDKVLFVIFTDGLENASKEYDRKKIFDMITEQRKKGWEFVYLGANQDAWDAGGSMGISASNISTYDTAKTGQTFSVALNATRSYRTGNVSNLISKEDSIKIRQSLSELRFEENLGQEMILTEKMVKQEPAGARMDEWINEYIFNHKFRKPTHGTCCTCQTCGHGYDECLCGYSTEIEKAWEVVEKMNKDGYYLTLFNGVLGMWACTITKDRNLIVGKHKPVLDNTVPLVISRTALLTKLREIRLNLSN